ncbi:TonB-dependent receptor [Niveispirillum sp.]|uniref:TonB-dependent receptor domain-containing protein n=1 Tax=Niveispirillum sp. TaxID=1917217 RepID=UPI001B6382D1|nr:TonB-dependent receptor [Niveispirillum sp.]MBP7336545.1 TonB-dependent receptor [Niveispirillum sp.]
MTRCSRIMLMGCSAVALALAGLLPTAQAVAQDAAPATTPPTNQGEVLEEIIVTGSRLARSGYNAPTPVTAVGSERMSDLGIANVGDALNQLPSFRAATTPAANLFRVQASIGARTADLRGLGPTRTLTLVDGRRFVPSSDLGTVDLNAIPSLLVARSEVVTGGASAAYGADAVAGVVNVILDSKFTGAKAELSGGISEQGDAKSTYAAAAWGGDIAEGRGHTVFGVEHAWEGGIGDINSRDWGRRYENYVSNPNFGTGPGKNGQPATIVTPNAKFVITPAGMIASGPLAGTQFDAAGNPRPFQFGAIVGGTLMTGGDAAVERAYFVDNVPLMTPNKHLSAFSHTDYQVSDTVNAKLELSYSEVWGGPAQGAAPAEFGKTISIDNAYLPTATRDAMIRAGVTSIPVNRYVEEYGPQNIAESDNKTYRFLFGLDGDLFDDWTWDADYQYGLTTSDLEIKNNRVVTRWNQSVDAVVAPNGQIVCRSTLTNPGNGCVPVSYFGINPTDPAVSAWAYPDAWQTRRYWQHEVAANARGTVFELPAGPVSVALGGDFRVNRYKGNADALSQAGAFFQNYATLLPKGGQNVVEGYLETNVPLLSDSPLGKSLEVDGAVRQTHYSKTGSATTWKVGAVYRPDDQFMFRVTKSRDIRAPTPAELSPVSVATSSPLTDPDLRSTYPMTLVQSGNPSLELEKASTFTAGGVIQPAFLDGFSLSVDYYKIRVRDAIDVLSAQSTINLCSSGTTSLCGFVARDPVTGRITTVNSAYQNLSVLSAAGWEASADYVWRLDGGDRVNFSVNANYVDHLTTISATGTRQEYANWTGNPGAVSNLLGVPRWRANAVVTYENDGYGITAQGRYIPRGILDLTKIGPKQDGYDVNLPNSANINHVAGRFYLDLSGRVRFNAGETQLELFGVVNNVFDKDPPSTLRLFGNPLLFDPIGRNFKAGVRARF